MSMSTTTAVFDVLRHVVTSLRTVDLKRTHRDDLEYVTRVFILQHDHHNELSHDEEV
jgi:hypothetical protein